MGVFRQTWADRAGSLEIMITSVNQTGAHRVDGKPERTAPAIATTRRLLHWLRVDAARLLWPNQCLVCQEAGLDGLDLCGACLAELPRTPSACPRCAVPTPQSDICGACLRREAVLAHRGKRLELEAVHASFVYAAPLDRLLLRFKFHGDLAAGALLSQLMAETATAWPRPDALVPVVLHHARLRHRGYDQALELARPLAHALDLPLRADLLQRVRATAPQSELDAEARARNLKRAFAVKPGPLPRHVVLIDDVMTTGATLHAAAGALKRAGVQRVEAWVCARVP
jgi:ComF family protein